MEEMAWDGPKWGREGLFPANPDLANILGDMDLDFEDSFLIPNFQIQVTRFPELWPEPGLGRALNMLGNFF